ncbi:hypothetical protein VTK73DRAFT_548 [Phialemonium thermophilum]|uniref:NACHT domain-containing protein n=1 Tax=Phialemonium thermophilum TaxID=223376 RepID=A0ABR3XE29_9PEZI
MDPFSIATGVAGLASLAIQLAEAASRYAGSVRSASHEIASLRAQLQALTEVLNQLEAFLRSSDAANVSFAPGSGLSAVMQSCGKILERLFRKLHDKASKSEQARLGDNLAATGSMADGGEGSKNVRLLKRLAWPFEKDEVLTLCSRLHECVQTFSFCLNMSNCKTLAQSTEAVMTELKSQEDKLNAVTNLLNPVPAQIQEGLEQIRDVLAVLDHAREELESVAENVRDLKLENDRRHLDDILFWISPLEPSQTHESTRSVRLEGTCQHLIESAEVQQWANGPGEYRKLCCLGDPGAGKTVFCSAVIDFLSTQIARKEHPTVALCYFYYNYRNQEEQTEKNVTRVLLKQLLAWMETVPPDIEVLHKNAQRDRTSFKASDAANLLLRVSESFSRIYICIDALDECPDVVDILERLETLPSHTRILLTGRQSISHAVLSHFEDSRYMVVIADVRDITAYLENRIQKDAKRDPDLMDGTLSSEIIERVVGNSNGVFLLASLQVSNVLGERTKKNRRRALDHLSNGIRGAYDVTIGRIQSQGATLASQAMEILAWVHWAERPLNLTELCHAIATEVGSDEFDDENLPSRNLISTCLGLVRVVPGSLILRLVHFSLRDYLSSFPSFPHWQDLIARKCLTYLMFNSTTKLLVTRPQDSVYSGWGAVVVEIQERHAETPLLRYAASAWGHHLRKTPVANQETIEWAVRYTSMTNGRLQASVASLITSLYGLDEFVSEGREKEFHFVGEWQNWLDPGPHLLAHFGLCSVLSAAVKRFPDLIRPDSVDSSGRTPLYYASHQGHLAMVRMLLDVYLVDVNVGGPFGYTPLMVAAASGHVDVVNLLLRHPKVQPNAMASNPWWRGTALTEAILPGNDDVLRILVGNAAVDVNQIVSRDGIPWTALGLACRSGLLGATELLLRHAGIQVNAPQHEGCLMSPLAAAIKSGHLNIVELLLNDRRVKRTNLTFIESEISLLHGCIPTPHSALALATLLQKKQMVELMLQIENSIHDSHSMVNSPIAASTREEIVANMRDSYGWTPFHTAALLGDTDMMSLLIRQRGDLDLGKPAGSNETVSCEPQRVQVNERRLAINVETTWGHLGPTPLRIANYYGYSGIVAQLINAGARTAGTLQKTSSTKTPDCSLEDSKDRRTTTAAMHSTMNDPSEGKFKQDAPLPSETCPKAGALLSYPASVGRDQEENMDNGTEEDSNPLFPISRPRSPRAHWAVIVFSAPLQAMTRNDPAERSESYCPHYGVGNLKLPSDPVICFRRSFDNGRISLAIYLTATDNSARLFIRTVHNGRPWFSDRGAHELRIKDEDNSLRLYSWSFDRSYSTPWAKLFFEFWEETVIFYCSFVALRYRSILTAKVHPSELYMRREKLLFQAEIIDDGFLHSLLIYMDKQSQSLRLHATAYGGELKGCPVWTAFRMFHSHPPF